MGPIHDVSVDDEINELLDQHLGGSCTKEELYDFIAFSYEDEDINLAQAVYGFRQSDIAVTNKTKNPVLGENKRVDELCVSLDRKLRRQTRAYSEITGSYGSFNDPGFAREVWEVYDSEHTEDEIDEVEENIMGLFEGEYENLQNLDDETHPLYEFSQFQKKVLEDMYGQDLDLPLLRGVGIDKAAEHSPEIRAEFYNSSEENEDSMLEQINSTGEIRINRPPRRDSWTDSPPTAREFGIYWSESGTGLILGNNVKPDNIALGSLTTPLLGDEAEFILEDDKEQFGNEDIILAEEGSRQAVVESYIWQLENL